MQIVPKNKKVYIGSRNGGRKFVEGDILRLPPNISIKFPEPIEDIVTDISPVEIELPQSQKRKYVRKSKIEDSGVNG